MKEKGKDDFTQLQSILAKDKEGKNLIEVHHILMRMYGWIPLEELRKLPMDTITNLMQCINKELEAEKSSLDKAKKRR